jgi:putative oxidoreductase
MHYRIYSGQVKLGFGKVVKLYAGLTGHLDHAAAWLPQLCLRSLLAWEFFEAGLEKYNGSNWFNEISFPFPINLLPVNFSWSLATYFELLGSVALFVGLGTRFFSLSLMLLTVVAIAAVHWPEQAVSLLDLLTGYRISDSTGDGFGNYKLPLIYLVMLLPLLLGGAGKLSVDACLNKRLR